MKHCMAIWADGHKILSRVDNIGLSDFAHRHDVVNVYEAFAQIPIQCAEVDSTASPLFSNVTSLAPRCAVRRE